MPTAGRTADPISNENLSEAAGAPPKIENAQATCVLILSELHCHIPDSAYIHRFPYILVLEPMPSRLGRLQRMRIEFALHDGESLQSIIERTGVSQAQLYRLRARIRLFGSLELSEELRYKRSPTFSTTQREVCTIN